MQVDGGVVEVDRLVDGEVHRGEGRDTELEIGLCACEHRDGKEGPSNAAAGIGSRFFRTRIAS